MTDSPPTSSTTLHNKPTAYCLLPTAYCLLPTAYCLLPSPGQYPGAAAKLAIWQEAVCHADGWIATIALTASSLLGQYKNLQDLFM